MAQQMSVTISGSKLKYEVIKAATRGDLVSLKTLWGAIQKLRNENSNNEIDFTTALHYAVKNNHLEAVKYLIFKMGIDVNSKDGNHGSTALHWASYYGFESIVKFLLNETECDPTIKNSWGNTARKEAKTDTIGALILTHEMMYFKQDAKSHNGSVGSSQSVSVSFTDGGGHHTPNSTISVTSNCTTDSYSAYPSFVNGSINCNINTNVNGINNNNHNNNNNNYNKPYRKRRRRKSREVSNSRSSVDEKDNESKEDIIDEDEIDMDFSQMAMVDDQWYIGDLLTSGNFSWTHRGYEKKSGKSVCLQFIAKSNDPWLDEQTKQNIVNKVNSFKKIEHENIIKLKTYVLSVQYPLYYNNFELLENDNNLNKESKQNDQNKMHKMHHKQGSSLDTVECCLFVYEDASYGELFNLLYFGTAFEEKIARSYFRQMIFGLECCHKAGIVYENLKLDKLLLDSNLQLKMTSLLANSLTNEGEASLNTVGERGYCAPELLLNGNGKDNDNGKNQYKYDYACDIFRCGVILFTLLTGYMPFEEATIKDRWYKGLAKKNKRRFWKAHRGSAIGSKDDKNDSIKDLISQMLAFNPKDRISIEKIKSHEWFNGKYLSKKTELRLSLRKWQIRMEKSRNKQSRRNSRQLVLPVTRDRLQQGNIPHLVPNDMDETIGILHTYEDWQVVLKTIEAAVRDKGGKTSINSKNHSIDCTLCAGNSLNNTQTYKFRLQIYLSKKYNPPKVLERCKKMQQAQQTHQSQIQTSHMQQQQQDKQQTLHDQQQQVYMRSPSMSHSDDGSEYKMNDKPFYAVGVTRLEGNLIQYVRSIKQRFLMIECGCLFTGVPEKRISIMNLLRKSEIHIPSQNFLLRASDIYANSPHSNGGAYISDAEDIDGSDSDYELDNFLSS